MKKSAIVMALFVCLVIISSAFTKEAPPRYQNLKVLPKNTTKEQMDSVMKHFTQSLNVRCNFCHVRLNDEQKNWDFASDDNEHKKIARDMMQMTNKLNKKYFDIKNSKSLDSKLEVTCYTCHHGAVHPAIKAPAQPAKQ